MQGHPHTYKTHDLTSSALHEGRRGVPLYGLYVAQLAASNTRITHHVLHRCESNITETMTSVERRFVDTRDLSSAQCQMLAKSGRAPEEFKPLRAQCPLFFRKVHKDAVQVAEDVLFGVLTRAS